MRNLTYNYNSSGVGQVLLLNLTPRTDISDVRLNCAT